MDSGTPFTSEDFGLKSDEVSRNGNASDNGYQNANEFWDKNQNLRGQLGLPENYGAQQQPSNGMAQEHVNALVEAAQKKDLQTLIKLAQIDQGDALAQIPSLAQDDYVASLKREIEELKSSVSGTQNWVKNHQESLDENERNQKISAAKERLKEMVNRSEFMLLNRFNLQELVWDAGREFAEKYGRLPNKNEILQMAIAAENSLRYHARPIREDDSLVLDPLDSSAIFDAPETQASQPTPEQQHRLNRPTVTNSAVPTANVPAPKDNSYEARRQRALEAVRRIKV